jgi:hypothetical protein
MAQREAIAVLDGGVISGHQFGTAGNPIGGDYVAPFAIRIQHESDVCAAIRIVFDALDPRCDAVFIALEIDDPVTLFGTAAPVPHGDPAGIVAAGVLRLLFQQWGEGFTLVQVRVDNLDHSPPAG